MNIKQLEEKLDSYYCLASKLDSEAREARRQAEAVASALIEEVAKYKQGEMLWCRDYSGVPFRVMVSSRSLGNKYNDSYMIHYWVAPINKSGRPSRNRRTLLKQEGHLSREAPPVLGKLTPTTAAERQS